MKIVSLLLLILVSTVEAAPIPAAPATGTISATPVAAAPTPPPMRWKVVYFGEYMGPRLSNFDLSQYQGPLDAKSDYGAFAHSLKVGYKIADDFVLGTQTRVATPFAPTSTEWNWKNFRVYGSWAHMIDTADIDMQGVLDVELPTSNASKNKGLLLALNLKNNFTFKTALRGWNFSVMTVIRPTFYNVQKNSSDVYFALCPSIQLDIAPDWALLIDGNFDAQHAYADAYFDFGQSDPDYVNIGIQYSFNGHFQMEPALTFYTADLSVPTVYMGITAAL